LTVASIDSDLEQIDRAVDAAANTTHKCHELNGQVRRLT